LALARWIFRARWARYRHAKVLLSKAKMRIDASNKLPTNDSVTTV